MSITLQAGVRPWTEGRKRRIQTISKKDSWRICSLYVRKAKIGETYELRLYTKTCEYAIYRFRHDNCSNRYDSVFSGFLPAGEHLCAKLASENGGAKATFDFWLERICVG